MEGNSIAEAFDGDVPAAVDEAALRRMRFVSHLLDDAIRVPGTDYRFGLDPVLGIAPVSGDVVAAGLSLYLVAESARLGVSIYTLVQMLANIAVDLAVGSIPYVGDLFDAVWKANDRNLALALDDLASRA